MLIDTHAHLNFKAYKDDFEQVVKRCQKKKMSVVNIGAQFSTSKRAADFAQKYDFMYAAIGLHPIHIFDEIYEAEAYQNLIHDKVVAIGETGFDYYHVDEILTKGAKSIEEISNKQQEVFLQHLKLAKKNDLALICHGRNGVEGREVYSEMLEILKQEKVERAVFHCYGGDLTIAEKIVENGYYIGIDGPVTFQKKAEEIQKIATEIPLENILIETDCPYLSPEPHRGKRNEPIYVKYVAEKIAELKKISKEEVIEQMWQNAKELFRI
ncbi:TatD family hydrolase [Patescibacteria group bacterium]|nr:TatD family hydrolase [Patescibacteria group bacterium]